MASPEIVERLRADMEENPEWLAGLAGTLIGPAAKTWDAKAAREAEKRLLKAGISGMQPRSPDWLKAVEEEWKRSGYLMDPSGQMRYEISDAAAKFTPEKLKMKPSKAVDQALEAELAGWIFDDFFDQVDLDEPYISADAIRDFLEARLAEDPDYLPEFDGMPSDEMLEAVNTIWGEEYMASPKETLAEALDDMRRSTFKRAKDYRRGAGYGTKTGTLAEAWDHPELYEAYPQLRDRPFTYSTAPEISGETVRLGEGFHGLIQPQSGEMAVNPLNTPEQTLETMVHEPQHLVQVIEGAPSGGSPEHIKAWAGRENAMADFARMMGIKQDAAGNKPGDELERFVKFHDDNLGVAYQRLPGEMEARLAALRRELTPEQLRESFPYAQWDQPPEKIIDYREWPSFGRFMEEQPEASWTSKNPKTAALLKLARRLF